MQKNYLELANTVAMNGAVLPHFRKTDSIMYLPLMKPVREKMRRLNLFDTTESFEAFTLAETLIVIGVIGIVSALTLPNLNSSTGDKEKVDKVQKTSRYLLLNFLSLLFVLNITEHHLQIL